LRIKLKPRGFKLNTKDKLPKVSLSSTIPPEGIGVVDLAFSIRGILME
jgi:hypothetical protein